jgi:hypothetical protein
MIGKAIEGFGSGYVEESGKAEHCYRFVLVRTCQMMKPAKPM